MLPSKSYRFYIVTGAVGASNRLSLVMLLEESQRTVRTMQAEIKNNIS